MVENVEFPPLSGFYMEETASVSGDPPSFASTVDQKAETMAVSLLPGLSSPPKPPPQPFKRLTASSVTR